MNEGSQEQADSIRGLLASWFPKNSLALAKIHFLRVLISVVPGAASNWTAIFRVGAAEAVEPGLPRRNLGGITDLINLVARRMNKSHREPKSRRATGRPSSPIGASLINLTVSRGHGKHLARRFGNKFVVGSDRRGASVPAPVSVAGPFLCGDRFDA